MSLHVLDIAENSAAAGADSIDIRIEEDHSRDTFRLTIRDNGRGMHRQQAKKAADPFFTTRTTRRVGLGLSLLAEAAQAAGGSLELKSRPGRGTAVQVHFRLSHIDAKPLGDMAETMAVLIMGHPEIDFTYSHKLDRRRYSLDTRQIKDGLDDVSITTPDVIRYIKSHIRQGLDHLRRQS